MKSTDRMNPEMKEKVQLFVTGELDEKEHKAVFDWISSSPHNRKYYDGLRDSLRAVEYYRSERKFDIQQVRSRLDKRIELTAEPRKTDFRILFRVAASLLLLVITYIAFQAIREHKVKLAETDIYNTIESPLGSRTRIYLPDSTYIVLNAGSTLRYPVDFLRRDNREVLLSGEGYFEVRKERDSKFVVRVGDIDITALGTIFNVKAYPKEALIEATLVEGMLRINRGIKQKRTVILRPNEKISIVKDESGILREPSVPASRERTEPGQIQKIPVKEVHVEKRIDPVPDMSWKDKEWVIRGKTMEELSVMLERRYNVSIELGDKEVGSFRFSGTLKDETLDQVLYAIRSTAPIDYQIDGNRIVLTQNRTLVRLYKQQMKDSR